MVSWLAELTNNVLLVLFSVTLLGALLGKVKIKNFSLGVSGCLFVGIFFGHLGWVAQHSYFSLSLLIFVVAVGLMASKDIGKVVRKYGLKFIAMAVIVPTTAVLLTIACTKIFAGNVDASLIEGVFTGALTSSPGLGASLESTIYPELITIGHSISYPIGVISVILFVSLMPSISRMDIDREKKLFSERLGMKEGEGEVTDKKSVLWSLIGFTFATIVGIIIGQIPIPLGSLGVVKLGSSGGGLIGALIVGYFGHIGPIHIRMSTRVLSPLRELSLAFFLAIVGLEAGAGFVEVVKGNGVVLIGVAFIVAFVPIILGYLIGRKVWHFDWIILSGAMCGAMTSTPGLGAAIETTGTEDTGAGYGATYPFAIVCMVVYSKLMPLIIS
ncbi:YidE/YbjL duplication [Chloroflexota bacterium]